MSIFNKNTALFALCEQHLKSVASHENLCPKLIANAIEQGTMVLLANPKHPHLQPCLVGQPAKIKVNANIGTSPMQNNPKQELKKLQTALAAGADTIMDLSIAGDLTQIRQQMLETCPRPIGTVPLYAVAERYINAGKDPVHFSPHELFEEIEKQAQQGVDFITVHCGLTARGANWADEGRGMGIVSRGGSILARWMREHKQENPLLSEFSKLLSIAKKYNLTLSLGDALRPGAGCDAGDDAQWEEVITLGRLAREALNFGVQCMIEGPGHVPMQEVEAQIRGIKTLCHQAPLHVLGPLVIDSCPGYDHIAGAIGGAMAVRAGADFLCYLTPAEHLTLPDNEDVHTGVIASKIAAQAGEVALGKTHALAREKTMCQARKQLNWQGMQEAALDPLAVCKRREQSQEEVCAMCGEFCAIKMMRNEQWQENSKKIGKA